MPLQTAFPLVDQLLAPYAPVLGRDFIGYRHHIHRVLNHFLALRGSGAPLPLAVQLAAPFHDLGIWTDGSFDYLGPSVRLARASLTALGLEPHAGEVEALITEHHKLTRYRGPHAETVETYRRADFIDVSLGLLRFGLPRAHLSAVRRAWPDAGFHWRLATLTARQFLRTPLRPLPMVHW
jgi:hypothetical protein